MPSPAQSCHSPRSQQASLAYLEQLNIVAGVSTHQNALCWGPHSFLYLHTSQLQVRSQGMKKGCLGW